MKRKEGQVLLKDVLQLQCLRAQKEQKNEETPLTVQGLRKDRRAK